MRNLKGYTLIEIMIVVILIGLIAGFALPNYQRAIRKAHARDAVLQLTTLHAANTIYRAQVGQYLDGTNLDVATINSNLNINIIANDMTYSYTGDGGADTFTATAAWSLDGNNFTVRVNQNVLESDVNPCCSAGTCPGVDACS